jgi:hypothetical protein
LLCKSLKRLGVKSKDFWAGAVTQAVECKLEALTSNPSTVKKKKKGRVYPEKPLRMGGLSPVPLNFSVFLIKSTPSPIDKYILIVVFF